MNSYIGFSNKHPEGRWSLQQFNRGFALIASNGTLRRIKADWMKKSN
jgi:polar amino acid transport system substrate-binding protein